MQKTVLSLSVAAALAVPTLVMAQAATPVAPAGPAVPTLDKVLDASGISATGYVDAGYTHANRNIEGANFSTRVFDSQNNSFVLHQAGLQIAKLPKEGFGALVNVTAGQDATVIHSSPEGTGAGTSHFDVTQGYVQYAGGPLTIIGGKFTTLHGTEVIWSPNNANVSRSILFGAVPFTHTGVRATYAAMDTLSLIVGLNNGWDQLVDQNKGKTLELGVTANPIKPLNLAASYYGGKEISTMNGIDGKRDSVNVTGSYAIIEPLSVGLEYLRVSQKDAIGAPGASTKMTYSGFAGYLSYAFMPKFKATLRAESFNDKDGYHFAQAVAIANANGATITGQKYKEYTLTLGYAATDNFELRGEVRQDKADNAVFNSGVNATDLSKSLTTYALQALYKF